MLLWQDLPLQWGYARGVRKQAVRQAHGGADARSPPVDRDLVRPQRADGARPRTGRSHRSGHCERGGRGTGAADVEQVDPRPLDQARPRAGRRHPPGRRALRRAPHPPQFDGTDSHLYFGWYWGDERDFSPASARRSPGSRDSSPSSARRPCPLTRGSASPERWPDLDWERLGHRHALQKPVFDKYVPPADYATFDVARRDAALSGDGDQASHRDVAAHQVPTVRWLRAVLLRGCDARRHVVGVGPRSSAQARLRRPRRGLPAGDRRRQTDCRRPCTPDQRSISTYMSCRISVVFSRRVS